MIKISRNEVSLLSASAAIFKCQLDRSEMIYDNSYEHMEKIFEYHVKQKRITPVLYNLFRRRT